MSSHDDPSLLDVCLAALLLVVVMGVSVIQARAEVAFREGYANLAARDPDCLVRFQNAALWRVSSGHRLPLKSWAHYRTLGRKAALSCPTR